VSVGRGDAKTASYSWRDDGQLAEATYEGVAVRPEYRDDGVMGSTVLTPPEKQGLRPSQWLRADYDDEGRVNKVTDSAGGEMHIQYDAKGRPKVWGAPMGSGKLEGVEVDRDADDRITKVRTSWGGVQDNRYNAKNGNLERVDVKNGTSKASLEYDQGKLSRVIQFDGGAYAIFYSANGPGKDLPREIKAPNGLAIRYAYGAENRLSSVTCGDTYELRLSYDDHGRLDGMHQIPVGTGETRQ
jgi:YD repeat-containing protein